MIELSTENDYLSILLNKKVTIQNISYKLEHDKNITSFLNDLIDNIENFNKLDKIEQYYFTKDFKEMRKTLTLLLDVLFREYKDVPIEKIVKCCNIFPDNIGERIVKQISYIPLLNGFAHTINYYEWEKNLMSEETLNFFKSEYYDIEDDFTDYDRKNAFILKKIKEYKENKDDIDTALSILITSYKNARDINKFKIELGKKVWNDKIGSRKNLINNLKKSFQAITQNNLLK